MSKQSHLSLWDNLPIVGFFVSEWWFWHEDQIRPRYTLTSLPKVVSGLPSYPVDLWPLLTVPFGALDESGVPYNRSTKWYPATYHPTTIAQYALALWNAYLATGNEEHRNAFLVQAHWLVEHETSLADNAGGWPLPFALPKYKAPAFWLSALTQGNGVSVLIRAYELTGEEVFLHLARRAVHTFELDIRDGGVSTNVGDDGIFFEEVAIYPASHILNGYIFALFGLYDYVTLTRDANIEALIKASFATLHMLIDQFDMGYWSRYELLHEHPATFFYHDQHSVLLESLARYSDCKHCTAMATRWSAYQRSFTCRLRYFIVSCFIRYRSGFWLLLSRFTSKETNN